MGPRSARGVLLTAIVPAGALSGPTLLSLPPPDSDSDSLARALPPVACRPAEYGVPAVDLSAAPADDALGQLEDLLRQQESALTPEVTDDLVAIDRQPPAAAGGGGGGQEGKGRERTGGGARSSH